MAELSCKANNCCYNQETCCCKGDIMVGGKHAKEKDNTCCESFHEKKNDSFSSALAHPSKVISIDCEAEKCVHNSNYKCLADKVVIKGENACGCQETVCGSFEEK